MTDSQLLRFYLPRWKRAKEALWMRDNSGAFAARPGRPESDALAKVETFARGMAAEEGKKLNEGHLRHAANLVATGKSSSKRMNNREINQAVALYDLLREPLSLKASVILSNPEVAERASYEAQIRTFPAAYVKAICRDKFHRDNWADISLSQLRHLCLTLRMRRNPARKPSPAVPTTPPVPARRGRIYQLKPVA